MGANEKHAATYHGGEYTPSEERVCIAYIRHSFERYGGNATQAQVEFDRWLETVRAEAKAEALNEAADWVCDNGGDLVSRGIEDELLNRANQYKENQ